MTTSYNIETKQYTDISEVTSFDISLRDLELFVKAEFDVRFFRSDGSYYKSVILTLEGDDYNNWGNSDEYVINKTCEKYGFVLLPP